MSTRIPWYRRGTVARSARSSAGAYILALALLALGMINLGRGDFTIIFHPMPEFIPIRAVVAAVCNAIMAATAMAILFRLPWNAAPLLLAIDFLFLSTGWTVRVLMLPHLIATWLGLAEQVAIAIGALSILAMAQPAKPRLAAACRIGFGLCQIIFALAHVFSLRETIAMTPAYLPLGQHFWALATAAVHLAGGVALLAGWRPLLATRCLAAMFLSFSLLVWLPRLIEAPTAPEAWAGNLINLALIGAVLAVGEAASRARRG